MIVAIIISALLSIPVSAITVAVLMKPIVDKLYEHLETLQKMLLEVINKHNL